MYYAALDNYCKMNSSKQVYNAGLYLRLSREDETTGQSESITNQKEYLTALVLEQGWNLVEIYIDDGFTGTNFNRPDFKRMLADIENRRINMVLTKDLSRLGRDYIDTGYYIERYFPEKNVRYIAVNDGIDTFSGNSSTEMSPFKNVINDFYARDISRKVRTAVDTRRRSGKFIGSFAPYGYKKDSADKNKLVPDSGASAVVRRIFDLYSAGNGLRCIARILNAEDVPSPAKYKQDNSNYRGGRTSNFCWNPETIRLILTNPTYIGNLTQKKCMKISYKLKKLRNIPKEDWTIVLNTHEPIVDKEIFELVQQLLEKKTGRQSAEHINAHLFSGLIYCGDCGSRMTYLKGSGGHVYAVCSGYKRFKLCTRHSFSEKELDGIVLEELKGKVIKVLDVNEFIRKVKCSVRGISRELDGDIDKEAAVNKKRFQELKKIIGCLYEDRVKGIISEENFIELSQTYDKERESAFAKLERLDRNKCMQEKRRLESNELSKLILRFVSFNPVDKATLVKLVNKIEIFEGALLKIYYNFKNPYI